ncbi:hypothetical protein [Comamonas sp.]|uniref:hypothetical protein n=1 Tax=Comamonas sp. TaxID=34028 RepID=UPI002FCB018A
MAAHRFWRATSLQAYGAGDLELTAFYLFAQGVRVDAEAILDANRAPDLGGTLLSLQDADLATSAKWSAQAVKDLALRWDFGATLPEVSGMRLAGTCESLFLLTAKLQWSDDGQAWVDHVSASGIRWPGAYQSGDVSAVLDPLEGNVTSRMAFEGNTLDATGRVWNGPAGDYVAGVSGMARQFGNYSLSLSSPRIAFGAQDFTIEMRVMLPAVTGRGEYSWMLTQDAVGAPGTRGFQFLYGTLENAFVAGFVGGNGVSYRSGKVDIAAAGRFLFVVFQRRADVMTVAVEGVAAHSNLPAGYVVPDPGDAPLTLGPFKEGSIFAHPFALDGLRITQGVARYVTDFAYRPGVFGDITGLNTVRGRAAPLDTMALGGGQVITFGRTECKPPHHLGVETGAVRDYVTGVLGAGVGRVYGSVQRKDTPANTPLKRRVLLVRERDGLVVREVWSDPVTGEYDFRYIDELQTWTVIAYDHEHNFRAVVADSVTPELIP